MARRVGVLGGTFDPVHCGHLRVAMELLDALQLDELPGDDTTIVVMCHIGGRSMQVVGWLRQQGYENTTNLRGGIEAWAAS